ncbi:MAG TPA: IPT/TIG domain-containing protein [Vicinamibacterales bacterium]|nr:IPT/TIG domain-containing protein [Vicinamibacterales bacterium]
MAGVFPSVVTTAGTWGTITGSQFEPGATVTIGNVAVFSTVGDSTTIRFSVGAHAAGSVDITVTNPGGHAATLAGGYTFTAPDSFDANGDWIAHADGSNHYLTDMRFTIRNGALISLSCGGQPAPVTIPITLALQGGGFSVSGPDGLSMSGRLDSMTTSEGRVAAPGCGDGLWWADKSDRF